MKTKQLLNVKKKLLSGAIFSLLLSGSFFQDATAQTTVQIGTGTGTTQYVPVYNYFGFGYSQQIYTAVEMNAVGANGPQFITKVRFQHSSGNYSNGLGWTVYLGNSSKTAFSSNTDWESIANLTNHYSGTVQNVGNNTWLEITLTTPFIWNGVDNIVVAVDENAGSYNSGVTWNKSDLGSNRSIYYGSDGNNPDPSAPPSATGRENSVPNIQFEVEPLPDCAGIPVSANITSALGAIFCENDNFQLKIDNSYIMRGITYQWQEFNGSTYTNILNDTLKTSSLTASSTTSYQVVVGCSLTGDEVILAPFAVTVNSAPSVVVDYSQISICAGDAATITASGAATYTWLPTAGLSNSNTAVGEQKSRT